MTFLLLCQTGYYLQKVLTTTYSHKKKMWEKMSALDSRISLALSQLTCFLVPSTFTLEK